MLLMQSKWSSRYQYTLVLERMNYLLKHSYFSIIYCHYFLDKIIKEVIPIFSAAKNELELPVPGQEIILYITYIKAANHFRANMVRVQPYGKRFCFDPYYF